MNNRKEVRDAFAFSLGGMTAITSFTAAPAIADDRIRQIREGYARKTPAMAAGKRKSWLPLQCVKQIFAS